MLWHSKNECFGIKRTDALAFKKRMLWHPKNRWHQKNGYLKGWEQSALFGEEWEGDGMFIIDAHVAAGAEIVVITGIFSSGNDRGRYPTHVRLLLGKERARMTSPGEESGHEVACGC